MLCLTNLVILIIIDYIESSKAISDSRDGLFDDYNTHEYTSYYSESNELNGKHLRLSCFHPPSNQIVVKKLKLPVDHFNINKVKKWKMQYLQNTEFWKPKSPIYVFVRGNTPMKYNELKGGIMYDLANETGGVMFSMEHRYYGEKDPYRDFTYLTTDQAIEDLNAFIKYIKKEPEYSASKVVLVGGGYGGSLAVWLKQAHPESANIVLASSAPFLAKADFKEYFMHAANVFKKYMPPECADKIKDQLYTYDFCLNRNHRNAHDCIESHFPFLDICDFVNMGATDNVQLFFLSELFIYSDSAVRGLRQMFRTCKNLKQNNRTRESSMFYDKEKSCYNYDISNFALTINENPENKNVKRWFYQCCNEFGFFPTTGAFPPPLSAHVPIELYHLICAELFGPRFDENSLNYRIKRTNERYGGLRPKVEQVIFVYGELDPWQHVGILDRFSDTTEVIIIPGVSHCKDLEPKTSSDPATLMKARKIIKELIQNMLLHKPQWGA